MVVEGDHDLINLSHISKLFSSLPHAELFVISGAAHIVPAQQPELVNRMVIKFLKTPYRDIAGYYFFK
jgi:pimeloyl-ACP methyl ester carboxylesterase